MTVDLELEIWSLCEDSGISTSQINLDAILSAYEGRPYHNWEHIDRVFARMNRILLVAEDGVNTMENWIPTAWAALYHDIIYGVESAELASAARLRRDLSGLLDEQTLNEAYRLILVTKDHVYEQDDVRAALICDADLGILASRPSEYREYALSIRREYASVDEDLYRQARIEVLNGFLRRDSIFGLDKASEPIARTNLKEEIASLRSTPWYESNPPL